MTDKDPTGKDGKPHAAAAAPSATPKVPPKNPRDAHLLNKAQLNRPGGHGFNPGGFSPKPTRSRNIGRGR